MTQTLLIRCQLLLAFVFFVPVLISTGISDFYSRFTKIAEVKNFSTYEQRDIYNTFDSEGKKNQGLPLDPFDLMNRLKKAGAMNNATTPSDALDEALNAFEEEEF